MSTPTLAEVLSPILADMRIKAANLRQGAPRIAEFADVADWIEGWELAIATAVQEQGASTPETATPEPTGPERVNTLGGSRVSAMPILALWLETTADACEGEPNSDAFNLRTSATLLRSLHAERDDAIAACERLQQRIVRLEGLIERDEPGLEDLLADSERLQQRVRELETRLADETARADANDEGIALSKIGDNLKPTEKVIDLMEALKASLARAEEKGTNA